MSTLQDRAAFIFVDADPRYWEDASVNGVTDEDGSRIPGRDGDAWRIKIDLASGKVVEWPAGTEADIHYKVCDQGEYWLMDAQGNRIAKRNGHYVPDDFLCHGDKGHGDYIILTVDGDGCIANYVPPSIDASEWAELATPAPTMTLPVRLIEIGNAAGDQVAKFQIIDGTETIVLPVTPEWLTAVREIDDLVLTVAAKV